MTLLEQWLYKAEEDLGSAKYLLTGNFYGTAIYHTQQAAEKAFKAYCVYISIAVPRTHNLDSLFNCVNPRMPISTISICMPLT